MKKFKVKVPATTANLGPGFDCLGLALQMYNEFAFEQSEKFEFVNFQDKYANENNLVVKSAKHVYQSKKVPVIPFKVKIKEGVPTSRGLGSSATCVVAGVLAANYFMESNLTEKEIIQYCTELEGHPDNIAPAIMGSLVSSVVSDEIICVKHDISPELFFVVAVPDFTLSTKQARGALPKKLSYSKAIHNMARAINIPHALATGNLDMLFTLLDDKMHEPFRMPLIEDSVKFKNYSLRTRTPFCISGSGSTLLFITKEPDLLIKELKRVPVIKTWRFTALVPDTTGAVTKEIKR